MSQEAQLKAQQHQNALMMQQRMKSTGQSILTLYSYAEVLSNFQSRGEAHDLSYWQTFVERFYSPGGVLRQGVWNNTAGSKQFEIATPALARYYLTQFTSGISQIQMCVEAARERESGNGGHIVESGRTSFVYWFKNECQVRLSVNLLVILFNRLTFLSSSSPMAHCVRISMSTTGLRCLISMLSITTNTFPGLCC